MDLLETLQRISLLDRGKTYRLYHKAVDSVDYAVLCKLSMYPPCTNLIARDGSVIISFSTGAGCTNVLLESELAVLEQTMKRSVTFTRKEHDAVCKYFNTHDVSIRFMYSPDGLKLHLQAATPDWEKTNPVSPEHYFETVVRKEKPIHEPERIHVTGDNLYEAIIALLRRL